MLGLAWLRRLKKYLRLSKGIVRRLRHLVNALRSLLRDRCFAAPAPSATGYSAATTTTAGDCGAPTGGEGSDEPWCEIAYWELGDRVGPMYAVQRPWLHVTYDERSPPSCDAELSLRALSSGAACKDIVARVRSRIGQGLTLLREPDGVWVYNRSEYAVFVASPTLDMPSARNLTVFKVPPGYSLRVYDWERARLYRQCPPVSWDGPLALTAVRISFVKGWGPKYARQVVTALPCSLELFFHTPPR
ncbi:hypothetical protein V5799_016329 [Amblyomma americanum]|uniref:MH2 domain-containing protein n=1 Tax=Amblyomma americanum TaxID=6943 RepID=A0AAQ4F5D0_AMBAM